MFKFLTKFYKKHIKENAKGRFCVKNSGFAGKQIYVQILVFGQVIFEQILPVDLMDCNQVESRKDIERDNFTLPHVPVSSVFDRNREGKK
jgi:hypothetical protein